MLRKILMWIFGGREANINGKSRTPHCSRPLEL